MRTMLNTLFVTSEDAYLSLENDNVVVQNGEKTLAKVPLRSIEQILSFSYKGASPALMGKCTRLGVGMSFYSPYGRFYCSVLGENNRNVLLRREQFRRADSPGPAREFAAAFVIGKVFNCRWVVERTKRDHVLRVNVERLTQQSALLKDGLERILACTSVDEVRGIEGKAAKDYFFTFDDLILRDKDSFFFEQRSRRPPMDRMNALLSFTYALLTNDCVAALQGVGLDPYVGFLHVDRPGRASLALDLMEEFRPVVADRFALTLVNTGAVRVSHFEERENGGIFLTDVGRKVVLAAWQRRKTEQITHPFLGEKIPWGLVPHVPSLLLARCIRGDLDTYPPFMWK
ncbi:type I-C CRISPR-associated endonuclease Cas1c [Bifidobacterium olomucense]|uniref:CRISPR-associated endonuclease Cas1 n=1 Tax=Bifidobacterium olomucense TaxID=2675324 RepID=A0A7Y0EZF7_9BIFI|nr:type I-C CRISPR-associated endonuclease Cas1c [Bifidobacterium sp. DSM 109959]NMM99231.1 subtype I-C CRISPR-associated endonuclease Cas1 [Bifidobacterium sp. DSM 109959]